jgi:Protein of unknown function (DUF3152)
MGPGPDAAGRPVRPERLVHAGAGPPERDAPAGPRRPAPDGWSGSGPAAGMRPGYPTAADRGGRTAGGRRGRRAADPAAGATGGRFAAPYDLVPLRAADGPLRAQVDPAAGLGRRPMTFASRGGRAPAGPLRRFVRAHGWRAYAIPVLTVLTVLCGVDVANGDTAGLPLPGRSTAREAAPPAAAPGAPTAAEQRPAPKQTGIFVDDPGGGTARPLPPTALPPGGPYAQRGGGRYDVVPGTSRVYGTGPLRRFTVEIEAGVSEDGPAFAAAVERTLGDPHSWGAGGRLSFQRVDSGLVDFRVSLTAALTVRRLCGYTLPFETSCYNGELGRAVINHARWVRGAVAYRGNVAAYRSYVVNHEVGHALGNGHLPCPRPGALAPLMMQQTLGVGRCRANPWPYP